jgi:hypothetical protein
LTLGRMHQQQQQLLLLTLGRMHQLQVMSTPGWLTHRARQSAATQRSCQQQHRWQQQQQQGAMGVPQGWLTYSSSSRSSLRVMWHGVCNLQLLLRVLFR